MNTQEKKIVDLMREIKSNSPADYYRMIGMMEGLKVNQTIKRRKELE